MAEQTTWREVVVVVPCYNEAGRLRLDEFADYAAIHPEQGFLFVDDGSTDETAELVREAAARSPDHIRLHRLESNRGKAEAVRLGMRQALDAGGRIVGFLDADLATPLEEVAPMVERLSDRPSLDGILGSRIRLLGRSIERRPHRHYLGRLFATAASIALRLPVYDTQCGAKFFWASELLRRVLETPFRSRWIFDVELLARLRAERGATLVDRLEEYPLRSWRDVAGSKLRPGDMALALKELAGIWRQLARLERGAGP